MPADCLSRHADPLIAAASRERRIALRDRIGQISAEMNSRGVLHSSIFVNSVAKACAAELQEFAAIAWDCIRRGFEACDREGENQLAPYFQRVVGKEAESIENVMQDAVRAVAAGLLNKSMMPLTEVQEAREHLSAKYEAEIAVYLAETQRRGEANLAARQRTGPSSWLIQASWFVAGILGTGAFWYFLSQKEILLTWLSGLGTLAFFGVAVWLHVKSDASSPGRDGEQQTRRKQISAWRDAIEAVDDGLMDSERRSAFLSSPAYSSLRPLLNEDVLKKVEAARTAYAGGARGDNVRKHLLLDEVARIEREWGFL